MAKAPIRAGFHTPFSEQLAAFRLRMMRQVPTAAWDDLMGNAHDRAFVVAGAMKADLLSDLALAVDKSIDKGTTLDEFRRDFRAIVERYGWHGWTGEGSKKGEAWRTKVIYQTNMRTSYAAGRLAQLKAGNFAFWVYLHGGSLDPREDHLSWHGCAMPPDHPFWVLHYPPNGWGCSCRVRGARSVAGVRRLGGNPDKELPNNWRSVDPKTGAPFGIDPAWVHAPGASVVETVNVAAEKIRRLPALFGAHLGQAVAPQIERAWPIWLAQAETSGRVQDALLGAFPPELVEMLANRKGLLPNSAVFIRNGLIHGPKARRHQTAGDALTNDDILSLPEMFQSPYAILRDLRSQDIIMLLGSPDRPIQMTIDIGRNVKAERKRQTRNLIKSLYVAKPDGILSRFKGGLIELLMGNVT